MVSNYSSQCDAYLKIVLENKYALKNVQLYNVIRYTKYIYFRCTLYLLVPIDKKNIHSLFSTNN